MPRRAIQQFATELEIPYLLHFTRATNLPSILEHGLYPIARVGEIEVDPVINDQLRLDGRLNGTSVSIAFPNCQMFYKYRMANKSENWAVLVLKRSILWEMECAFCRHNAADGRISRQPLNNLMTEAAFRGMYDEIENWQSREEQKLKPSDPTDVQAEVMVFDVIDPSLIHGVVFNTRETKDEYAGLLNDEQKTWVHTKNNRLFGTRSYSRLYK